jgi:hypothetical protein
MNPLDDLTQVPSQSGRLFVTSAPTPFKADIKRFEDGEESVLLFGDFDRHWFDDMPLQFTLRLALQGRGSLELISGKLVELVGMIGTAARSAAYYLEQGKTVVLVVCDNLPVDLIAACVLVAAGLDPGPAVETVRSAVSGALADLDSEVAVSVFAERHRAFVPWNERLPTPLLEIAHRGGGSVSEFAVELLVLWDVNFNRLQSAPTADEVLAFSKALKDAENALPAQLSNSLRFALKPWNDRRTP